jgi:hypothetical protein
MADMERCTEVVNALSDSRDLRVFSLSRRPKITLTHMSGGAIDKAIKVKPAFLPINSPAITQRVIAATNRLIMTVSTA